MKYNDISFNLTDNFISQFKNKQPKWGPLGYFIFKRTYARTLEDGRTEEFWETLKRVVEGVYLIQKIHCKTINIPWNERQAQMSAQEMYRRMWEFKFLPPGRGLWTMGTEFMFKKGSASLINCAFVSTKDINVDFSTPFSWTMDMSLYGVGVGFDTRGAEHQLFLKTPRQSEDTHIVEDSREGWVQAYKRVLDAYVGRDTLPKKWDFSKIRPAGSPIKSFGGVAPGSDPLKELLRKAQNILNDYIKKENPVDSALIVDLMNLAGAAVVAGGTRRTAQIAFGDPRDQDFINLKQPKYINNSKYARWASNNSIFAEIGMDYSPYVENIATNGEPGFMWLQNARAYGRMIDPPNWKDEHVMGSNPCGEISLESYGICNLVETFPVNHDSLEDYLRTLKYAYLYSKTVTLLPTHDAMTNAVILKTRRIGLSQSGIIDQIMKVGFREHMNWCNEGYKEVQKWDNIYSDWLCIPKSIKTTTVKPSGTVSLLCGVSPGIHFPHDKYYIRRVRVSKTSNLWKTLQKAGYPVEEDKMQPDYTMVISFPIKEKFFSRKKRDISIWEQFELASAFQRIWADNQVSITVTFKKDEIKDIPRVLSYYEDKLKSVSLLPLEDHTYEQAPYETISEDKYNKLVSKLSDYTLNTDVEEPEKFCDGDSCLL